MSSAQTWQEQVLKHGKIPVRARIMLTLPLFVRDDDALR